MKPKFLFLAMILSLFVSTSFAQDYEANMDSLLVRMESQTPNFAMLSAQFESLQQADPSRWEASYYLVFSKIMLASTEKKGETIDRILDDTQTVLTKLTTDHPKESEFQVLQGWLCMTRISVAPMTRGMEYMQKANASLANALALDKENPRIYYLQGMETFHMPKMLGGGSKNALPFFRKANEKFATFKPSERYSPKWGQSANLQMIGLCEKEENK